MKRLYLLLFIACLILGDGAYGEDFSQSLLEEQMDFLKIDEIEGIFQDLIRENEALPKVNIRGYMMDLMRGKASFSLSTILGDLKGVFVQEIGLSLSLMGRILVITIISAILTNLQSTFENASVAELANYATYVLIAILVIGSFTDAMTMAKLAIDKMVQFMQIILPILLTLLTAVSGPNTKILFHPMIIFTISLIGTIIKNIIIPLIYFSFVISIISNISKRMEFSKLSELGRQVIGFIISISLTLFIGMISIYGLGTNIDGLTIRTAKFAVDKLIPVVGGFLSDAMEAVVGCSAILKNGFGFIALLILVFICIIPIVKLLALLLVYRLAAVVIQPIASDNLVEFFNEVGKALFLVLISLISTATMFFITITIIVEAGNNLLMLR